MSQPKTTTHKRTAHDDLEIESPAADLELETKAGHADDEDVSIRQTRKQAAQARRPDPNQMVRCKVVGSAIIYRGVQHEPGAIAEFEQRDVDQLTSILVPVK